MLPAAASVTIFLGHVRVPHLDLLGCSKCVWSWQLEGCWQFRLHCSARSALHQRFVAVHGKTQQRRGRPRHCSHELLDSKISRARSMRTYDSHLLCTCFWIAIMDFTCWSHKATYLSCVCMLMKRQARQVRVQCGLCMLIMQMIMRPTQAVHALLRHRQLQHMHTYRRVPWQSTWTYIYWLSIAYNPRIKQDALHRQCMHYCIDVCGQLMQSLSR